MPVRLLSPYGLSLTLCIFLFFCLFSSSVLAQSAPKVAINSIVVSKNCVETQSVETQFQAQDNPDCPMAGDIQLIQVAVENLLSAEQDVTIALEIKRDGKRVKRYRERRRIAPHAEYKMLYSYKIPNQGGQYHVAAQVQDSKTRKRLAVSTPGIERKFYILRQSDIDRVAEQKEEIRQEEAKRVAKELEFDPPDLRWETLHVVPRHVLRSEKFRIRLDLINVGGDIVRGVKTRVDFFNVRLPRRRTGIAAPKVDVLAPGETVTFELDYTFPDDQLLGEYQILAIADPNNLIHEIKDDNNERLSEVMRLSDIKILIPPDGFQFEETGLFLFQWESLSFREFKLQIGTNDQFEDPTTYFDLPQGERWIADKELVPLSGELPTLAQGLMKTFKKSIVYWRVVGRRLDGTQSFSDTQTFSINNAPAQ